MCLYQTPDRRPPHITGRGVNSVTGGRVGAPNERAPFKFHDAVVGFVDRCRFEFNIWLSFSQADLGPISGQAFFFSVFFGSLEFLVKICAHCERYRNVMADIFEIQPFFGIAFPLASVYNAKRRQNYGSRLH